MGKTESIESIAYRKFPKGNVYRSIEKPKPETKQDRVKRIVGDMERRLGHPESVMFYRKCAWHMSEDEILSRIETAVKGHAEGRIKNPLAYFIYSANKLLQKRC